MTATPSGPIVPSDPMVCPCGWHIPQVKPNGVDPRTVQGLRILIKCPDCETVHVTGAHGAPVMQ